MKIHPSDLLLEDLLSSRHGEEDPRVRHLAGCPYCRSRLWRLPNHLSWLEMSAAAPDGLVRLSLPLPCHSNDAADYGPAIERSERKYLERDQQAHLERRSMEHEYGEDWESEVAELTGERVH